MENLLLLLLIVAGLVILVKSSDVLVYGATQIAYKLKMSPLLVGLTIVAFGTSAPELAINLISAFYWRTELALSNVLGSNIANTLLILWATALIYPITIQKGLVQKEIPFNFIITVILALLTLDTLAWCPQNVISRLDAGVLLSIFAIYFMYLLYQVLKKHKSDEVPPQAKLSVLQALGLIALGVIWLTLGWRMIVKGASQLALNLWIPPEVIGATIIAIGTSLPELAVSITAALKKQADIALGNVVGSNIFNILWILGLTWLVYPLPAYPLVEVDLAIAAAGSLLLLAFAFWIVKYKITRLEWATLLLLYVAYLVFLTMKVYHLS